MTVSDQGTKQKVSFREGVKTAVLDIGITWVVKTGQATDEMDGQTVQVCVPATAAALATPRAKRRRAVTPAECALLGFLWALGFDASTATCRSRTGCPPPAPSTAAA